MFGPATGFRAVAALAGADEDAVMMLSIALVCASSPDAQALEKISLIPSLIAKKAPKCVVDYEILLVTKGGVSEEFRRVVQGLENTKCVCLMEGDTDALLFEALRRVIGDHAFFGDANSSRLDLVLDRLPEETLGDVLHVGAIRESRIPFQQLVLSRTVLRSILAGRDPVQTYRTLPNTGGFSHQAIGHAARRYLSGFALIEALRVRWRATFSSKVMPLRIVSLLALFGAGSNTLYSIYVLAVLLVKKDVIPGWVTLSMQQSGMFLLFSMALFVGCEYVIHAIRRDNRIIVIEEVRSSRKLFDQPNVEIN